MVGFLVAIVYGIHESGNNFPNVTNNTVVPSDTLLTLLAISWPLPDTPVDEIFVKNQTEWKQAFEAGQKALNEKNEIAKKVKEVTVDSPSYKHQNVFISTNKTQNLADLGYKQESARKFFPNNTTKICNDVETVSGLYCFESVSHQCGNFEKFRTYNGSCNNLVHHHHGVAFRPFRRALPPDYADGISTPRVAKDGRPLPSARTVSLEVHRPYYKNDDKFTVMLAVWGQFLDHDITATAPNRGFNGSTISCCEHSELVHPECFPVRLDRTDPLSEYNITCMEFVRSAPAPTCCIGYREQLNQVTAFIDASVIYGIEEETVRKLRTFTGGQLEMYLTEDNRTLLPVSKDLTDGCNRQEENRKGRYCFFTGDARANENLHLTTMHLIWTRQHNLIAGKLASLNKKWNDERIFQETRKILGAQMQHITYSEFLPILLGNYL